MPAVGIPLAQIVDTDDTRSRINPNRNEECLLAEGCLTTVQTFVSVFFNLSYSTYIEPHFESNLHTLMFTKPRSRCFVVFMVFCRADSVLDPSRRKIYGSLFRAFRTCERVSEILLEIKSKLLSFARPTNVIDFHYFKDFILWIHC